MRLNFLGLFLLCANASAGVYWEAGIGKNGLFQDYWVGRESTACMWGFGYNQYLTETWIVNYAYRHHSHCTRGDVFDGRKEFRMDSIGIYLRYETNP